MCNKRATMSVTGHMYMFVFKAWCSIDPINTMTELQTSAYKGSQSTQQFVRFFALYWVIQSMSPFYNNAFPVNRIQY